MWPLHVRVEHVMWETDCSPNTNSDGIQHKPIKVHYIVLFVLLCKVLHAHLYNWDMEIKSSNWSHDFLLVMLIALPQELSIVFVVKQKLLQISPESALQAWLTAMDVLNCSEKILFIEQVWRQPIVCNCNCTESISCRWFFGTWPCLLKMSDRK